MSLPFNAAWRAIFPAGYSRNQKVFAARRRQPGRSSHESSIISGIKWRFLRGVNHRA